MRTIRLKLKVSPTGMARLLHTMEDFNRAVRMHLDWGWMNRTSNKMAMHAAAYRSVREEMPSLRASLVQSARDCACEMLRATGFRKKPKRGIHSSVRYNNHCASIFLESQYATLSTNEGRVRVEFQLSEWHRQYLSWRVKTSILSYKKRTHEMYLGVAVETETPEEIEQGEVMGIDRGLRNVAVTSDARFFSSSQMNEVRGRYAYLRGKLQAKGTRSAKRLLRNISGRERRYNACQNHIIAKEIVNAPYAAFALEDLSKIRRDMAGRGKISDWVARWPFYQLEEFISYKAEALGKKVIKVNPANTSRRCSRCGHIEKRNRNGNQFHCLQCGFSLDPDLNASRNIAERGKALLGRLCVDQPNVSRGEERAHSPRAGSFGAQMQVPYPKPQTGCSVLSPAHAQTELEGMIDHYGFKNRQNRSVASRNGTSTLDVNG